MDKLKLRRMIATGMLGGGRQLYASDGFSLYPTTDGFGVPDAGYRGVSGRGKPWTSGYGTWATTNEELFCTALVGGTGVKAVNTGVTNCLASVKISTYVAGWSGVVVRYYSNRSMIYAYWDATRLRLVKLVDTIATVLITGSSITLPADSILSISADLNQIKLFLNGVQQGTTQTVDDAILLNSPLHGVISSNIGNGFDNFNVYPNGSTVVHNILPFGDSKTIGDTNFGGFPSRISTTTLQFVEYPTRIATGGATVASRALSIGTDIAASLGTPEYILFNLGANDVAALPLEATWKADCTTIINALHAKWPLAKIYMMRPWRQSYLTECNSIATWINDLVGLNTGVVYNGPDERVFLEGGDDGATYTVDGIHPNAAGYALTATQWVTALGY